MSKEPRKYDDDDGRVIANMNVEGMPWHDRQVRREKREERRAKRNETRPQGAQLTRSEARRYTFYAVLAGLTVALVFSLVWILLTLFMTRVWF